MPPKKYILKLILLFYMVQAHSQGLKSLDNDYGIGRFKLGSAYSVFSKNLKYFATNKEGVEFYTYTSLDKHLYFGKSCKEIGLGFYEGRLYTVSIGYGTLDKTENIKLLNNLKDLYDIPEVVYPNNKDRVWVAVWESGKVYLQATEYSCDAPIRQCETEVFIYSKTIKRMIPID
jgi:hypothetical protein